MVIGYREGLRLVIVFTLNKSYGKNLWVLSVYGANNK